MALPVPSTSPRYSEQLGSTSSACNNSRCTSITTATSRSTAPPISTYRPESPPHRIPSSPHSSPTWIQEATTSPQVLTSFTTTSTRPTTSSPPPGTWWATTATTSTSSTTFRSA